jgi:hypothetical protein
MEKYEEINSLKAAYESEREATNEKLRKEIA